MKDHPIPQDVTGYKFHIVGNMTLKQFGLIVFGVIVAFIIYQLKLPALIAWPFIVIFAGGGLLAAFIPIEERPLDHWILTFIRTLYRPTQFFWRREPHVPAVFEFQANNNQNTPPPTDLAPAKRARIHDYLNSLHNSGDDQEVDENASQLAQIMAGFQSSATPSSNQPAPAPLPSMTVKVRALAPDPDASVAPATTPTFLAITPTTPITPPSAPLETPPVSPEIVTPLDSSATRTIVQAARSVQVPSQDNIVITHRAENPPPTPPAPPPSPPTPLVTTPTTVTENTHTVSSVTPDSSTVAAQTAQQPGNLPFPSPPTQPNLVVGMVVNHNQELLPGAIVEVATTSGQVVRVVRTNALGQFFVTTPLPAGSYILQAEQDGLQFTPQHLEITTNPVAPILFSATG